jgi:hypothetical protein
MGRMEASGISPYRHLDPGVASMVDDTPDVARTEDATHRHGRRVAKPLDDSRRVETLINVFRYAANIVIVAVAVILTLGIIGISITPLLATAGVAGIAVGFGAQILVGSGMDVAFFRHGSVSQCGGFWINRF